MHFKPTAGFDLNPEWQRTLPSFGNLSWDMHRVPSNPNIKVDLQPTAGCQISTLKFGFEGTLYISHDKLPKDGKVLCHLGFTSKVLPGPLTELSA
jgi:hypothetical protein